MKPWDGAAAGLAGGSTTPFQISRILSPISFFNFALIESRKKSAAMPAANQPGFERKASIQRSVKPGSSGFSHDSGLEIWQKWSLKHAPSVPVSNSTGKISKKPDASSVRK